MKVILLAALLAGVSASVSARSASEAAALATFKQIVEKCSAIFGSTDGAVSATPDGKWSKLSRSDVQTSFDVRKTASLASPITGTLKVSYLALVAIVPSEDEAQSVALDPAGPAIKVSDTYNFAFRDGEWVGVGIDESRDLRTRAGQPFTKLPAIRKDASRIPPQSLDGQCLGAAGRR